MSAVALEAGPEPAAATVPQVRDDSRRRFTIAAVVGTLVASVPYLWFLTNDWSGTYNPLRGIPYFTQFYDEQAKSMIHGHLWVAPGSLGIEGFIHNGRTYTYFGLLLSIFRIPILVVAPSLTGRLTAPSMLAAWLLTALFSSLLIWRVRVLLRGAVAIGRAEAVSLGVLVASILGGSVLLFLASAPWVYDEDIAWSIPTTIATLFVFVGILDRPSGRRVLAAGVLLLAGVLGRPSPALACIVGALLIALWLRLGREGEDRKRWALPLTAAALVPLATYFFVNWLKFGTWLNGLPLADQVWTHENAHRRAFLAATGGKGYSVHLLPTDLWAYLQPLGLRAQSTFPFLTLPVQPPRVFGGYIIDWFYPTASVPASMPMLFLLSCWGLVVSFRPGAGRGAKLMRIPLIAAAGATVVDFFLGYIAPRYLGDFLPFLVLGAAIGVVGVWRVCEHRGRATKAAVVGIIAVLAIVSWVANVGIASSPTPETTQVEAANYIQEVRSISDLTGHPLAEQVTQGDVLPYWAPAGEVFVVADCSGVYLSTGYHFSTVPASQLEHRTWVPVERGPGASSKLTVAFHAPAQLGAGIPILTIGRDTVLHDPRSSVTGGSVRPVIGRTYQVSIETDANLHLVALAMGNYGTLLQGLLSGAGPGDTPVVHTQPSDPSASPGPLTVGRKVTRPSHMALCHRLLDGP